MIPERWARIKEVLATALEQPKEQRAAFLNQVCGSDQELRREVDSLLAAELSSSLKSPAAEILGAQATGTGVAAGLAAGQMLGHYRIDSKLGEGGMGVVYKARDTHLDRFVAIKVLPPQRVADPERKRRFVQEAKAASALNHPNIITIHDITSEGGIDFMVMEFVPGKALDQLIPRKGLRLNEALKYAVEIADALAAAHAAGIVHRDVKPSNLMVTEKGHVKVLDFGLAKLTETTALGEDEPTRTLKPATEEGAILGTVAYMSPEQAQGRAVDARSDIFSFGSLLYEMVTGRRPFHGDTKISALAAIIKQEPAPLGVGIPYDLEKLISRCLRKQPERRFQHVDDVKIALQELKEESDSGELAGPAVSPARTRRATYALIAALAVLAVAVGAWYYLRRPAPTEAALSVAPLTSYPGLESQPAFSPDGNDVAFTWNGAEGGQNFDIYRKLIGPGQPLRLTTDPASDFSPAWSPDGRWIAFLRQLKERKSGIFLIPALGGPERLLGEVSVARDEFVPRRFLDWSLDGKWLAACDLPAIVLLSVETGERRRLTTPPAGQRDYDPALSPDGRSLAFSRSLDWAVNQLYVAELGADLAPKGEPMRLTPDKMWIASHPAWTRDGQEIVFAWGHLGNLNLWRTLARRPGPPRQLTSSEEYACLPALSRRGDRLVFVRQVRDMDIWRMEAPGPDGRAGLPKRLISSTRMDVTPQFSPDGSHVAFLSGRSGNSEIWICASDGASCRQVTSFGGPEGGAPRWSPDGTQIVYDSRVLGQAEIYMTGAHGGPSRNLTNHPAQDLVPSWSRDGRWIYFTSERSGRSEVWKMPAQGGEALQVTRQGGMGPLESADGGHVYYLRAGGLWKVPAGGGEEAWVLDSVIAWFHFTVTAEGIYFNPRPDAEGRYSLWFHRFSTGKPTRIADIDKPPFGLSVSPDGRWILYSKLDRLERHLMLVENFR
jgi:serine/threonine protein kinase/dipeptidyl aminopeptidase/acylaminoacyl peptidase